MATAPINPQSQRNPDCLRQTPEIRAIEGRERIIRNHVCVVVLLLTNKSSTSALSTMMVRYKMPALRMYAMDELSL